MTVLVKNAEIGFSEIYTSEENNLPPRKYRPKKTPYIVFKMSNVSQEMQKYLDDAGFRQLGTVSEEMNPKTKDYTQVILTVTGDRKVMEAIKYFLADPRYADRGNQELRAQLGTFKTQCQARYEGKPKKSPPPKSKPFSDYKKAEDQQETANSVNVHYWVKTKSGRLKMFKEAGGARSGGEIEDFNTECQRLLLGDMVPKVKPVHDPVTGERIGHVIEKIEGLQSIHDRLHTFIKSQDKFYEPTREDLLKQGVALSEEELLNYGLMKIYTARFIEGDSDPHGGNYGFGLKDGKKQAFSFDYDRAEFQTTSHFAGLNPKKASLWQGYETAPKDMFPLTERDIVNFPYLQDAKPMRGPTHQGRKGATLYLMDAPQNNRVKQSNGRFLYLYRTKQEGKEEQTFYWYYKGVKYTLDNKDVPPELKTASFKNERCDDKRIYIPVLKATCRLGHTQKRHVGDADLIQFERVHRQQKVVDDKYYILLKRVLIPDEVYIERANRTIRSSKKRELLLKAKIEKTKKLEKILLKDAEFHDYLKRNPEAIGHIEDDFVRYNRGFDKDNHYPLRIKTNQIRENYNALTRKLTPGFFTRHSIVRDVLIGIGIGLAIVGIAALIYATAGLAIPGLGSVAGAIGVTNASIAVALEATSFVAGCALLMTAGPRAWAWMRKKIGWDKGTQMEIPALPVVPALASKIASSHVEIKNTLPPAAIRGSFLESITEEFERKLQQKQEKQINKVVSFLQKNKEFFITICENSAVLSELQIKYKDDTLSKDLLILLKGDPRDKSEIIEGILALKNGDEMPLKRALNKHPRACSVLEEYMKARVVEDWNKDQPAPVIKTVALSRGSKV